MGQTTRKVFTIRYYKSRAADTYGQQALVISGEGVTQRALGGGYDMLGVAFADVIMQIFPAYFDGTIQYTPEQIRDYPGLRALPDGKAHFNGAWGVDCVEEFVTDIIGAQVAWEYRRDRQGRREHIGVEIAINRG